MVRKILTDKLYLSVVGIVVVFVVAVAYIFSSVLSQPLLSRPDTVNVDLAQTGGLFEGSQVTYRGVRVGQVTRIVPTAKGVTATIKLTSSTQIPKDSMARVRSLSPVGEQYLDFQPRTDSGPYIQNGDTIGAASTDIPESLSSTVIAINKVLRQIDDKKLRIVLSELSTGLAGTGDDIGQILDQGSQLLHTLVKVWPQTNRLIDNSGPVLSIITGNSGSLEQLAHTSKHLAAFLKGYDPELVHTLKTAPSEMKQMEQLINDANNVLPGFLATGVSLTDIFASYDPHFRALLQAYQPGLQSLLDKIGNHRLRIALIADKDPRCSYGTTRHDPRGPRFPFQTGGHCPSSFSTLQRGAAHAPGPVR
ncbi:MAG: MCE family protein [Nocardioidaceae bacterium]|nr:MCE family protein [Nocardioidaceae bacterium]MCL2611787.1 MCE family protein [Nocardioidaceae bacterium]